MEYNQSKMLNPCLYELLLGCILEVTQTHSLRGQCQDQFSFEYIYIWQGWVNYEGWATPQVQQHAPWSHLCPHEDWPRNVVIAIWTQSVRFSTFHCNTMYTPLTLSHTQSFFLPCNSAISLTPRVTRFGWPQSKRTWNSTWWGSEYNLDALQEPTNMLRWWTSRVSEVLRRKNCKTDWVQSIS